MIKKDISISKRFFLSQEIKFLFLIATVALGTTLTVTAFSTMASAQENKTTSMQSPAQNPAANTTNANIVLVHGTAVDRSFWNKVIPILQNAGHKVVAAQLPLHSLADDVDTVKREIGLVGGPVILVGHSYGGFVISNAAYNDPNVTGLVYLSAFAPNEGQSLGDFVDPSKLPKGFAISR